VFETAETTFETAETESMSDETAKGSGRAEPSGSDESRARDELTARGAGRARDESDARDASRAGGDEAVQTELQEGELLERGELSLLETLDHVLNRGIVIAGEITISVADIDLIFLGLNVLLTSTETAREVLGSRGQSEPGETPPAEAGPRGAGAPSQGRGESE
jgi:Gas vesicle protein